MRSATKVHSSSINILKSSLCNRAENMSQTCKKHLVSGHKPTLGQHENVNKKNKAIKYAKVRHKSPHESISSLVVSNILNKF